MIIPKPVFISYSTDDTASAEQMRDGLEAGDADVAGIACWMAPRDIAPGLEYGSQIVAAIEECSVLVLLLSESSNRSRFVLNEVERAVSKNKIVIPVRIHNVQPSRSLEFFISNAQWIDAWQGPLTLPLESLTLAIRTHLIPVTPSPAHPITPPSPPRHNLPAQTTRFVGREKELADLDELLDNPEVRLISIVGPGGMGKTRLSIESARRFLDRRRRDVFFAPLAPLAAAEHLVPAIATAVKYTFFPDERTPRQQLLDFLREREMLLVLDNFEHLIVSAVLVSEMLQAAPGLQVLVTSRERLRLSGEKIYSLQGMEFPEWETPADTERYNSIQLFLQGAHLARPDFSIPAEELVHVTRICRLVEGLPLAILMAAAWAEFLSLPEISQEIGRSLDFLESNLRDAPERQRSMRAVFDYSWRLLGEAEQQAFVSLAVFRGSFSRQAAQEVCGISLPALATLVNKSLLHTSEGGRYEMHQLLRQYAGEKLRQDAPAEEALRDRHAAYYLSLVGERMQELVNSQTQSPLMQIQQNFENVRAAWTWALGRGQISLVGSTLGGLNHFYNLQGWHRDGAEASQAAAALAARSGEVLLEFSALIGQAEFSRTLGDPQQTERLLAQAARLLEELQASGNDMRRERASLLLNLALLARYAGDGPTAKERFAEAAAIYETLGDERTQARALGELSNVLRSLGDIGTPAQRRQQVAEAVQTARHCIAICRRIGYPVGLAEGLLQLGASLGSGDPSIEEVQEVLEESLALYRSMDIESGIAQLQCQLTFPKMAQQKYGEARSLNDQALIFAQKSGDIRLMGRIHMNFGFLDLFEGASDTARHHFQTSVAAAHTVGERHFHALALCYLGYTEWRLGNSLEATRRAVAGLRISIEIRAWWPLLFGTGLAALLLAECGQTLRGLELCGILTRYGEREFDELIGPHLLSATANVPAEASAAAQARGRALDLWTTVHQVLAEIEELR